MAKYVAIANQKGGVGKTTTSVNLAASLAFHGQEVLLIDLDPQANATSGLGIDKRNLDGTIYDVLSGDHTLADIIQPTGVDGLEIAPSRIDLIGAEVELIAMEGREHKLKNCLVQLNSIYQYIFLDCPPSLGVLTLNALCAAQSVLIPIQCEYYAMEGLSQLMDTIYRIRESLNPELEVEGVLLTMFDSRIKLANDVANEVRNVFKEKVYSTIIPRNVRLAESPSFGKPILQFDFPSRGSQSYLQLAYEFLSRQVIAIEGNKSADSADKEEQLIAKS